MSDKIKDAYKSSKNIYDTVLTQGNIFSRLYIDLFWSGTDDNEIARKVLSYIPDDFSGKILDVPVGTAVFTADKWTSMKNAEVICLDYSEDMIHQAEERLSSCTNIECIQGDVGALPFEDESFDIVLSMNGFHAFPDKAKAFKETYRVLKTGGSFVACYYIRGKSKITDMFVKSILSKRGWFSGPFQSEEELKILLNRMYSSTDIHTDGSIVYFKCVK